MRESKPVGSVKTVGRGGEAAASVPAASSPYTYSKVLEGWLRMGWSERSAKTFAAGMEVLGSRFGSFPSYVDLHRIQVGVR